jgi:hypothetical protein
MLAVLATVSLWFCTTTASGQTVWSGVGGSSSCTQYAQAVRSGGENIRNFYFTWAQGFMSGINSPLMEPGKSLNLAARAMNDQQAFIDRFCDQRPLAYFVEAVLSLYDTMRTEQGLHDWRRTPKY